ncbi:MAG TPA: TonB-dependent receptor [Edaphocola sp.]|nr:TonB-dependent receptor [Edaphocola sp.]
MTIFKIISLTFFLSLVYNTTQAQYKILGAVRDKNNVAIEFANISLQIKDSIITQTTTDSLGSFAFINITSGAYQIITSHFDAQDTMKIDLKNDTLINIFSTNNSTLEGVVVTGKRPAIVRKTDRLIFTPNIQIVGNAMDILAKTPMITVIDDNISIIGKSSIQYQINGKTQYKDYNSFIQYLRGIPADDVSRIEVITNPPAQFDAQGNSGVINIILKKKTNRGLQTNISNVTQYNNEWLNRTGLGISYDYNKLQLYANLNGVAGNNLAERKDITYFSNQDWNQINNRVSTTKNLSADIGINYDLTQKWSIGTSIYGGLSRPKSDENINTSIFQSSTTQLDSLLTTNSISLEPFNHFGANFNTSYKINESGQKLTFEADCFQYTTNRTQDILYNFYKDNLIFRPSEKKQSGNDQNMEINTANILYELPTSVVQLSFGGKLTFIKTQNQTNFYNIEDEYRIPDNTKFDNFVYSENTQAIFANASKYIPKWGFQFGLRGENTQTKGNSIAYSKETKDRYFKLFPSLYIVHQPNEKSSFSLNYNRRIDRPGFVSINPFIWYSNPYAYTQGNPQLKPYFINAIDFNYIYLNKWFLGAGYSNTKDMYSEITFFDTVHNTQVTNIKNFINSNGAYISLSANHTLWDRWVFIPQFYINYFDVKSQRAEVSNSKNLSYYFSISNQIYLNKSKTFLADINGWYMSPMLNVYNHYQSRWSTNIGLSKYFLDQKLKIALKVNDIFKSEATNFYSTIADTRQEKYRYNGSRYVQLNIQYNLLYGKSKKVKQSQSNKQELKRTDIK